MKPWEVKPRQLARVGADHAFSIFQTRPSVGDATRVKLDSERYATHSLGDVKRGAVPGKRIEHIFSRRSEVAKEIFDETLCVSNVVVAKSGR